MVMIYAPVDVEFRDHERLSLAVSDLPKEQRAVMRFALLGLFTWGLLYCRSKKRDGDIPCAAAEDCGVGVEELIRRLLAVDLWVRRDGYYLVRKYLEKNDGREEIERRIAQTSARKQRYRDRRSSDAIHPPEGAGDAQGTRSARVPLGVGVGDHDLVGDPDQSQEGSVTAPARARLAVSVETCAPLPDEAREIADGLMLGLRDLDAVWAKFSAHARLPREPNGPPRWARDELPERWRSWCATEASNQRSRRDLVAKTQPSRTVGDAGEALSDLEQAYVRGVEEGKGGAFILLEDQRACLRAIVARFGNGKRDVRGWLQAAGADFAEEVTSNGRAQFYSAYQPRGFARWLAEDDVAREQRRDLDRQSGLFRLSAAGGAP